jgi:fructose-bisphosphate aldolase class II
MISWGVKVNDYGNAQLDENGQFLRQADAGVTDDMWTQMVQYAQDQGWKGGDYKKLNRPFENRLLGQQREIRERMIQGVEDFTYHLLTDVFNAEGTASLAAELLLDAGSHDLGPKVGRIEDPDDWTREKIVSRAAQISSDKGPKGDFDD